MGDDDVTLTDKVVLIAGATSTSGRAAASALHAAGARVIAVGTNQERLDNLALSVSGIDTEVCDLTSGSAVLELAMRIHHTIGPVDGVIQLVGGWRGGGGLTGQSDVDWAYLERALTSLRNTSRVFYDDLVASPAGRFAMVSSTSVDAPKAGGANYAAMKAASEAWTRALANGLGKDSASAAAVIFVVTSLDGLETKLAERLVGLWSGDAAAINGARIPLTKQDSAQPG
ncbi:MAG: SDR family NAD(P)-dependent oxidoreductase [Microbacteriaceae bacterium]